MNLRKLHRKIAPVVFLPLFLTALTGVAYRLGRSWFGISDETAEAFLWLHQGTFLGRPLVPIYVLLVGLGLIGMIITGLTMLKRKRQAAHHARKDVRWGHRILAAIAFLPLFVSAVTGIAYRLGRAWFGLSSQQAEVLLQIHQGSYLGSTFRTLYVLFLGIGLIGLLITGIRMVRLFRKPKLQS